MTYNMFLDDERDPIDPQDWVVVRSFDEAVACVEQRGMPTFISFDHDLGDGPSGRDFAGWLGTHVLDYGLSLDNFDFYVHSQNPIGKRNIQGYMDGLKAAVRGA